MQKCISDYLDSVCSAINGKTLRHAARAELTAHILERREELIETGLDNDTAAREAVARMGDPSELGKRIVSANRSPQSIISLLAGIALAFVTLSFLVFSGGGELRYMIDLIGFGGVVLLGCAYAFISCGGKLTLTKFLRGLKNGALYAGAICFAVSLIVLLHRLDTPESIGPAVSVALLSAMYGCLLSAGAHAAENRLTEPQTGAIRKMLGNR